jgi:nucleoid DNA-binding protein
MRARELIRRMSGVSGTTPVDAEKVIRSFAQILRQAMTQGDKCPLPGAGHFDVVSYKAVASKLPTGAPVTIPARRLPKFLPCKSFKAELKSGQ